MLTRAFEYAQMTTSQHANKVMGMSGFGHKANYWKKKESLTRLKVKGTSASLIAVMLSTTRIQYVFRFTILSVMLTFISDMLRVTSWCEILELGR